MKIFEKYNFDISGEVLPLDKFYPLSHCGVPAFNKRKIKNIKEEALTLLNKPIAPLTLSLYRSYQEHGSTTAYGSPYCDRLDMAYKLLIAELDEGEGRYCDKLLDVVWAMLDESTWVLPEHTVHLPKEEIKYTKIPAAVGDKYPHGLELGACYRAAVIALVYHYMREKFDEISPLINERIVYELKNRIIDPFINYEYYWSGVRGNKVNNWCPWIVANVLLTTALVEEDIKKRERVVELSMKYLDNFINSYKPDGGCEEGPTYWSAAAGALFDALEMLEELSSGKINIYNEPLIKAMGEYVSRVHITGNYFVNFADSRSKVGADGDMLRRYGEKCSSPTLTSFGDTMLRIHDIGYSISFPYRGLKSITAESRNLDSFVQKAATDTYFPDLKVMVLRESENPGVGMFFAMKGGHNNESHNHNDIGSFVVYCDGNPVLIDAGVGEYTKKTFSPQRYEIWSMQSLYHNLPSFNGIGQMQGECFASKNEIYNKDERSLSLELADAWVKECGITSFTRKGCLMDGVVTLVDNISLESEQIIDFVFLTHIKPEVISQGKIALNKGCVLNYDASLTPEIEEFIPEGMETTGSWGTEYLYRIHLRTSAKTCEYTFKISKEK